MLKHEWYEKSKKDLKEFKGEGEQAIKYWDTYKNAHTVLDTLLPLPVQSLSITFDKNVNEVYFSVEICDKTVCYVVGKNYVEYERVD